MIALITNDWLALLALSLIVLIAGFVRGAIGFGFSALVVAAGALFLSPAQLAPMVILLEVVASVQMLPKAWPLVHWRAHNYLLAALVLGTPLGVYALAMSSDTTLRVAVALFVLCISSLLITGFRFSGDLGRGHLLGVGLLAGLFNGISGIGGMPIAAYLNSSTLPFARVRATLVVVFFGAEGLFIASALFNDVYSLAILFTAIAAIAPMSVGIWLGSKVFDQVDGEKLRRMTVVGLFCLALVGLLRVLWHL